MKLHKLDVVSLIFGAIFTPLGLAFIGFSNPWRSLLVDVEWGWLAPLALVAVGVVVMLPLFKRSQPVEATHPGEAPASAYEELPPNPLD